MIIIKLYCWDFNQFHIFIFPESYKDGESGGRFKGFVISLSLCAACGSRNGA